MDVNRKLRMPRNFFYRLIVYLMVTIFFIAGCASNSVSGAPQAIEAYFKALVAKDLNQLVNHSCAEWEGSARQELRTFDAVQVSLQDLSCQEVENDASTAHLACTGKIIANYGNEVLEINLAERDYRALFEGGEWRMCGYQ